MNLSGHILWLACLLILSGFFSACETALFSLSKIQLNRLKEKHPAQEVLIVQLLNSPRRTLNTILTGNMLVNITASALVTDTLVGISGEKGLSLACGLTTLLLLIFGEVTPKSLAISHAEILSRFIARPLHLFAKFIFPICFLWSKVADSISQRIIGRQYLRQPFLTEEEIRGLVSIGEKEGIISKEEEAMISTVFDFSKRYVNEIMTPRVDIVACDFNATNIQLENVLKLSRHSKIPVYKDRIDNILGIIYAKEYLLKPHPDWQDLVKPVLFVPETKRIAELLVEFQTNKSYIAVVTDEYGGTSGLVTVDDILEEIVGEIRSEYATEEKLIVRIDDNSVSVSGKTNLYDLNEELNTHFKAKKTQSVGGLMINLFGRIPKSGESITYQDYTFTVDDVRRNRIRKVTIRKK